MTICPCCGGAGEHETRPHITASPEDQIRGCTYCEATGQVKPWKARNYDPRSTDCSRRTHVRHPLSLLLRTHDGAHLGRSHHDE